MKITLCDELLQLSKQFKKLGKKLYVVGGYVRDSLRGKLNEDIDICSSLTPDEISKNIKDFDINIFNQKLGSVHIKKGNKTFEHTTFRVDYYHDDGKHSPYKVEFTQDLYTDSFRRDFSINSIYYDIQNDEIIDFFGGIEDIKKEQIKAIVSPEYVFGNDGIRLLRMVRFACQLNYKIEEETFECAKEYIYQLKDISSKRIYDEFERILLSENYNIGLEYLKNLGAYSYIFKDIDLLPITEKINTLIYKNQFKYITKDSPKEKRMELFLIDIIQLIMKNCYDKNATLEGIAEYILQNENFGVSNSKKENIISTILALNEFETLESINDKKALLLDNIKNIDLLLHIAKNFEEYIEIYDIYTRLTSKNIAIELKDFCIKNKDIIGLGLSGKNISLAMSDIFLYSVIYEINEKEILIKVLEKFIKEKKYE